MPTVTLHKADGSTGGELNLSDRVFAAPQNKVLVREAVNTFLANQRQGTHSTRTRGMVRGGGRKPWRQKGTGRARQGSIRATQWRGGAVVFGPQPRDYSVKINRKKRQAALRAVLSARLAEEAIYVVETVDLGEKPRTKAVVELVDKLQAGGRVLFVTEAPNETFLLSARNIPYVNVTTIDEINIFDLLVSDSIIFTKAAIEALQEEKAK